MPVCDDNVALDNGPSNLVEWLGDEESYDVDDFIVLSSKKKNKRKSIVQMPTKQSMKGSMKTGSSPK
uniref:Uncharacterized protein n=1 Tax=Arundo donax TaxID=35708 RepID=A0A0A9A8Z6_ARUDO